MRDIGISVARGVAIIAIVAGHVLRGLDASDMLDAWGDWYGVADRFLYSWHLPVFAFLSGLFVRRGVEQRGRWRYLVGRLVTFGYLYLLWSLIQGGVKVLMGSLVNTPVSVGELFILWIPDAQFWFLPFLMAMTLFAVLIMPWRSRMVATATLAGAALISLAFWGNAGYFAGFQGYGLVFFYFAGVLLTFRGWSKISRGVPTVALVGITLIGAALCVAVALTDAATLPTDPQVPADPYAVAIGVLSTVAGTIAVLAISVVWSRGRGTRAIAYIGDKSLEIYLAHILFASGARIVLARLGVEDPWVQLAIGVAAGVAGPIALSWLAVRVKMPWLFKLPNWAESRIDRRPA